MQLILHRSIRSSLCALDMYTLVRIMNSNGTICITILTVTKCIRERHDCVQATNMSAQLAHHFLCHSRQSSLYTNGSYSGFGGDLTWLVRWTTCSWSLSHNNAATSWSSMWSGKVIKGSIATSPFSHINYFNCGFASSF